MRGLIVGALKHALAGAGHRASTTVSDAALGALRAEEPRQTPLPPVTGTRIAYPPRSAAARDYAAQSPQGPAAQTGFFERRAGGGTDAAPGIAESPAPFAPAEPMWSGA